MKAKIYKAKAYTNEIIWGKFEKNQRFENKRDGGTPTCRFVNNNHVRAYLT